MKQSLVLKIKLDANFGSSSIFSFFPMPTVAATDLEGLLARAGRWIQVPRPDQLPLDIRLREVGARSAFAIATFRGTDFVESCHRCGLWTCSWCEGCYLRDSLAPEEQIEYSPICTECDQSQRVCDPCQAAGLTWAGGHEAAQRDHGHKDDGSLEITGFVTQEGQLIDPEATVRVYPMDDGSADQRARNRPATRSD